MNFKLYSDFANTRPCNYLFLLLFLLSCSGKDDSKPAATAPSNLTYNPASLQLNSGQAGNSVKPTVSGTMPVTYSLSTTPGSGGAISIDADGTIKATGSLAVGEYKVSVTATNTAGSVAFTDVYRIENKANPVLPSVLTYSPNTLSFETGGAKSSAVPTVVGTKPVTFAVTSVPATDQITIDDTGKITIGKDITAGTYNLSVTATNAAGSAEFKNVYTATATALKGPTALAYSPNLLTVTAGNVGTSATPTITGTGPITYTVSSIPATTEISIDNAGIIAATGSLTVGTYNLSITASNADGNRTFSNAYTVKVESANPTTFNDDVKAIIQGNCAPCHTTGPQPLYVQFTNAKNGIESILDRIQRAQGAAGMMPQGGTKLSADQINIIKKWKEDGMKE